MANDVFYDIYGHNETLDESITMETEIKSYFFI